MKKLTIMTFVVGLALTNLISAKEAQVQKTQEILKAGSL
ncbi:Uncharacterised protein [Helicobacter muridarum]|uniref:Uncharacterized protein n=1 Tax=Helicobacter muridarum TaxID=216 RepID=A0A377PWK4_9HELI|nr:Uncharacterised protein [Helicobacter muridarum]